MSMNLSECLSLGDALQRAISISDFYAKTAHFAPFIGSIEPCTAFLTLS